MTAAAIWIRMIAGEDPRASKMIRMGADLCLEHPPIWYEEERIDMCFWYAAAGALRPFEQHRKLRHFPRNWNMALSDVLYKNARTSGAASGSWDPLGAWGSVGGRVYSTAIGAMALLETRLPLKETKKKR